jgi:DNA repair exonuclease SbcCD ATPase subunit
MSKGCQIQVINGAYVCDVGQLIVYSGYIGQVRYHNLPLTTLEKNVAEETWMSASPAEIEGDGLLHLTAPGTYRFNIDCDAIKATAVPADEEEYIVLCYEGIKVSDWGQLISQQLEALCEKIEEPKAIMECLAELKLLTAANNNLVALAGLMDQLKELCDKLLKQAEQNDGIIESLENLASELIELCEKVASGNEELVSCLQDLKTLQETSNALDTESIALATEANTLAIQANEIAEKLSEQAQATCDKIEANNALLTQANTLAEAGNQAAEDQCDKIEAGNALLTQANTLAEAGNQAAEDQCDKIEAGNALLQQLSENGSTTADQITQLVEANSAENAALEQCLQDQKTLDIAGNNTLESIQAELDQIRQQVEVRTHVIEGCLLSDPADPNSDKISAFTVVDDTGTALFAPIALTSLGFVECC